jgi:hypothetical protein
MKKNRMSGARTCAMREYARKPMARQVSDPATSEKLCVEAARYHAEAAELETGVKTWELKEPPEQN